MTKIIVTLALMICSFVFGQASFEQGMQKAFELWQNGKSTVAAVLMNVWQLSKKPLCEKAVNAVELFANFNPETAFHPNWGLDRAKSLVEACNRN